MKTARIAIFFVACLPALAQPDVKALLRQSIQNYERDWRSAMNWEYTQTDVVRSNGREEMEVSEVIPLEGTPYDRLVARNGHPLSPSERQKEDDKFQRVQRQRRSETPAQREARIRKYETERSFLKDLPNAYDFKLAGEEMADGRTAWILSLTPRLNFVPTTLRGGMLKHIEGRLWIDKQDLHWAKAEAHVIEPIAIGWILARIGSGAKIQLDMDRVANGLWMPHRIDINGSARVLMVHNKTLDEHLTFTGYHAAGQDAILRRNGSPSSRQ